MGIGKIAEIDDGIQVANAWWNAREAIESVDQRAQRSGWSGVRTELQASDDHRTMHVLGSMSQLIDVHIPALSPL